MLGRSEWFVAVKCGFILAATLVYIFVHPGLSFELSPTSIEPGQEVILTGITKPESQLTFQSGFTMNLPVTAGEYEYEATVEIPQKPNRFTVTARNVQDFSAGVKFGIWITKSFSASGGIARISQGDVPPGRYDLKVFGKAMPGSLEVPVTVEAETQVQADSAGRYELAIDTSGIPAGDYRIEGAGDTKTIRIGGEGSSAISTSSDGSGWSGSGSGTGDKESEGTKSGNEKSTSVQAAKPVQIDRRVIQWYAPQVGLDVENSSQYDEAEKLLKKRLSGGYWKIIARGEPLTEEAGDCQQEYCLVRGIDACTVCREKDTIAVSKGNPSSNRSSVNLTRPLALPSNQSTALATEPVQGKSLWSMFLDWVRQLLGLGPGG